MANRVAILGGVHYGATFAIRSAIDELPTSATVVLTASTGVCVVARQQAESRGLAVVAYSWKHNVYQLFRAADDFYLFYDGSDPGTYRHGADDIPRVLRRLAFESRSCRLYLPTGRCVANPYAIAKPPSEILLASAPLPCSDAATEDSAIVLSNVNRQERTDDRRADQHHAARFAAGKVRDAVRRRANARRAITSGSPAPLR